MESVVDKITSPNLQDDDYSALLDLVELVNKDPVKTVPEVMRYLQVKFQSTNANVLLRTITMLDFLAQNCGAIMKANIASKDFIDSSLISTLDDTLIHINVKYALIKEIYKLHKSFKDDPTLQSITRTFNSIKSRFPDLSNQAIDEIDGLKKYKQSNLNNNSNNSNPEMNQEEDLELKKAIELSLRDANPPITSPPQFQQQQQLRPNQQPLQIPNNSYSTIPQLSPQPTNAQLPPQQIQQQQQQPPPPQIITPAKKLEEDTSKPEKVVALYDLSSDDEDTLSFKKDDIITIVEEINADWLRGCLNGRAGIVPTNYVKKIPRTVESDLQNLINALNSSFDIEMTLSQLMDLNKKVKTTSMTSQQFESTLLSNSFPNKIQKIEEIKNNLKQILELHKLKLLELESIQANVDNSLKTYQSLITEMAPAPEDPTISRFIQTYPDISSLSINPQSPQQPQVQAQLTQPQMMPPTTTGSANYYLQQQQQQPNPNMYNY